MRRGREPLLHGRHRVGQLLVRGVSMLLSGRDVGVVVRRVIRRGRAVFGLEIGHLGGERIDERAHRDHVILLSL